MWDKPQVLNAIANALFALAIGLLLWAGVKLAVESPVFLLRAIRIEGELVRVSRADIVKALEGRLAGTFFNMDIDAVRALFESVPWVRRAEVRRIWPDRLEVRIEEHLPMARWGQAEENRLVNRFGEIFTAVYTAEDGPLPQFSGPPGSGREVLRRHAQFAAILRPLALRVETIMLSPRQSWQLRLSNGLVLQLGRDSEKNRIEARLARFVSAYAHTLAPLARRLEYVDLRYANGFALRVPGLNNSPPRLPERKKPA